MRVAGPADLRTLAAFASLFVEGATEDGFEARLGAWLEAERDRRTLWLAELRGEPVGLAAMWEYRRIPLPGRPDRAWGYVGNMFVVADVRDQGIGAALLTELLATADARGYARVVLAPSPRSVPFYTRAGFVDAGPEAGPDRLLVRRPPSR